MKKIALTGGGTAGHITPNTMLLPKLKKEILILFISKVLLEEKQEKTLLYASLF